MRTKQFNTKSEAEVNKRDNSPETERERERERKGEREVAAITLNDGVQKSFRFKTIGSKVSLIK
jgi:hypothetical protein